jgi:hypothetical protein
LGKYTLHPEKAVEFKEGSQYQDHHDEQEPERRNKLDEAERKRQEH